MNEPYFIYNGKHSIDLGLRILNDMYLDVAETDLNFVSVLGKSFDVVRDNQRYPDITKVIPVELKQETDRKIPEQLMQIGVWLKYQKQYSKLVISEYEGYYYKAICHSGLRSRYQLTNKIDFDITFKCQPFFFRNEGSHEREIGNGGRLNNPESFESFPIIKFYKTTALQDTTIYINGEQFRVSKDVGGGWVTMDFENGLAYKEGGVNISKQCFINNGSYNPITLQPGQNQFSFDNARNFTVVPNWRTLAI